MFALRIRASNILTPTLKWALGRNCKTKAIAQKAYALSAFGRRIGLYYFSFAGTRSFHYHSFHEARPITIKAGKTIAFAFAFAWANAFISPNIMKMKLKSNDWGHSIRTLKAERARFCHIRATRLKRGSGYLSPTEEEIMHSLFITRPINLSAAKAYAIRANALALAFAHRVWRVFGLMIAPPYSY